jgi:hypothetical protein
MSRVYSYYSTALSAAMAMVFMAASALTWAAEPFGQLIDSPYEAVEARAIELSVNASGDVVQIRAEGCPGCPSSSILSSGELVVEAGKRKIDGVAVENFSGMPGVIHIHKPTGMAYRVSFPGAVFSGAGDQ